MTEEVKWDMPDPDLGMYTERDTFYQILNADYDGNHAIVDFMIFGDHQLPGDLVIDNKLADMGSPVKTLAGILDYVENWYPPMAKPPGIKYDTPEASGGNYASYGIYAAHYLVYTFTLRAYHRDLYDPDVMLPATFKDRIFTITIEANYSDCRDAFMRDYFSQEDGDYATNGPLFINGVPATADEYIAYMKSQGYYE